MHDFQLDNKKFEALAKGKEGSPIMQVIFIC